YGALLAPAADRIGVFLKLPLRSGVLFDVRTGRVLWERNPEKVVAIASLTKMMTALVVVAHARPSESVLISKAATSYTGSDLALLTRASLEQPRLARIVATRNAAMPFPIKGGKLYLYNNNPLLRLRYPGTDGVKTGYTDAAGRCLVATVKRGPWWLGVVLLH